MKLELSYNFDELVKPLTEVLIAGEAAYIKGAPGIGKSSLAKEIGTEIKRVLGLEKEPEIIIINVPLLQPTDYAVPFPNKETGKIEMFLSELLPLKGPVIVLFDDLPQGKPFQMLPVANLILDRRIANKKFADDVWFIATGNREEDMAAVNPIPSHILDRFFQYDMKADPDQWVKWASYSGEVCEEIRFFIKAYPQYLWELPQEGVSVFATPRGWHKLSKVAAVHMKNNYDRVRIHAFGKVGSKAASVFMSWIKYLQEFDPMSAIEAGTLGNTTERANLFAKVCSLTSVIKAKKIIQSKGQNIIKIFNELHGDFRMLFLKEMIVYKGKNQSPDTKLIQELMEAPGGEVINEYLSEVFAY